MDPEQSGQLRARTPANAKAQLGCFMAFGPGLRRKCRTRIYDGDDAFKQVLDMLEAASAGLLEASAKMTSLNLVENADLRPLQYFGHQRTGHAVWHTWKRR